MRLKAQKNFLSMHRLLVQICCCNILSRRQSHLFEIFSFVAELRGRKKFGKPLQKFVNTTLNIYVRQHCLLHDWSINYQIFENMPITILPFLLYRPQDRYFIRFGSISLNESIICDLNRANKKYMFRVRNNTKKDDPKCFS